jgi:2,4-diketo-3-deoxy-L-fuconate hydrolase
MRLVGIGWQGQRWIAVERDPEIHLLTTVDEFYSDVAAWLERAKTVDQVVGSQADWELQVPVPVDAKVLCAGLNYTAHASESQMAPPAYPDVFGRWASTLAPSGAPVRVPVGEPGLDWEGELVAVLGKELTNASPDEVEAAVIGYTCFNDISARKHQLNAGQWTVGKNADGSGPMGPALVTRDEIPDPYALRIQTRLDGEVMQDAPTSDMIFSIGQIGSYISECITLRPGDVIATGTPEGVGAIRKPPKYMQPGQVVEVAIEGIGVLTTPILGPSSAVTVAGAPALGRRTS